MQSKNIACSFKKSGMTPVVQYMCCCLDCFHSTKDLICLFCKNSCHKTHKTTLVKLTEGICHCGARNMCGTHRLDMRNFEIPKSALDWKKTSERETENVPEKQNLIARQFDIAVGRLLPAQQFDDRGMLFNVNTREVEKTHAESNDTIYHRKTSNYQTITSVNTKKEATPNIWDVNFGNREYMGKKRESRREQENTRSEIFGITPEEMATMTMQFPQASKIDASINTDVLLDINNEFAFELLNNYLVALPTNKIILSPYEIMTILIALYRGSNELTEKEIQSLLSCSDKETMLKMINATTLTIPRMNSFSALFIANLFHINKSYQQTISPIVTISKLDSSRPEEEVHRINKQISQETGYASQFLSLDFVQPNTGILAINTCQFRSTFRYQFESIKPESFYGYTLKIIPMMTATNTSQLYTEDSMNQLIELFYSNNMTLGVLLPKNKTTINKTDWAILKLYIENLKKTNIGQIKLPKFTQQSKFDLRKMLENMGAKEMFYNANFSTISSEKLNISAILHQTTISIDEAGTELGQESPTSTIKFIANHPFIYYIRHLPSGLIQFVGVYQ